jgi:hypothetical protein
MEQDPVDVMGCFQLYYDEVNNIMLDEGGFPVFNIFDYIEPYILYLFKQGREYMLTPSKIGPWVELIWPEHDDEELNLERSFDYE